MEHYIQLFGQPFLVCSTMIFILGYLGIHVLKREIIFIDIALAQIAAVGAIAAHIIFGVHGDSFASYLWAFGFTIAASIFYSFTRRKISQIPLEAIIGVSYAIAAGAALFLVGIAPGGHIHIHQMLAGSILWVTSKDLLACVIVFSIVGLCFYIFRKPFREISDDYGHAVKKGIKVIWWDFLFYALFGIVITLVVRIGGVVVVFAFLIIPATISALFSSKPMIRLISCWGIGVVTTLIGFLFSDWLDFSVGPTISFFLGVVLILAGIFSYVKKIEEKSKSEVA
ncbi:MAG: metal ABC transporter permease [Candidatus Omnitrophica bacterium]|nr:metal ABC transporter permease [Candidatus Omnitrophota bacterium]